jgi:hypothetical protein
MTQDDEKKYKHDRNIRMAHEFCRSITELLREVCRQSARENSGVAQFIENYYCIGRDSSGKEMFKYKMLLTPKAGLFKLILKSSRGRP